MSSYRVLKQKIEKLDYKIYGLRKAIHDNNDTTLNAVRKSRLRPKEKLTKNPTSSYQRLRNKLSKRRNYFRYLKKAVQDNNTKELESIAFEFKFEMDIDEMIWRGSPVKYGYDKACGFFALFS